MSPRLRVLLVDDEELVRAGLRLLLGSAPDLEVVGEAEDGTQVVARVRETSPDVVLMDIRMPRVDGLRALQLVRALPDPPQVVMLTTFGADDHVITALEDGAAGFLLKDTPPRALLQAVRTVAGGTAILSPTLTGRLVTARGTQSTPELDRRLASLSDRERQLLPLVARGDSNADIAGELFVSEATVKAHLTRVLSKLDCTNRVQVAIAAYRGGLVTDPT